MWRVSIMRSASPESSSNPYGTNDLTYTRPKSFTSSLNLPMWFVVDKSGFHHGTTLQNADTSPATCDNSRPRLSNIRHVALSPTTATDTLPVEFGNHASR